MLLILSLLQLVPLFFVWLLPDSKAEQKKLRDSGESDYNSGAFLLAVVSLSLVGTIIVSIALI